MISRSLKIALFGCLAVFLLSSFLLLQRFTQQQLWSYLPLIQFSSLLLFVVLGLKRRMAMHPGFWRRLGLGTLSAIFLSVGFPPFPFPFFLFIGFVPLLLALDEKEEKYFSNFFLLYYTFLLWNILTTYWVANTAYFAGIFANTVNAFLMTLPVLTYLFVVKKLGPNVGLMSLLVAWLSFEFLHMRWELYWPWLTLGNGLAKISFGIQWYSYTGALGGSAWILILNYVIFRACLKRVNWQWKYLVKPAAWLVVPLLFSVIIYFSYEEKGDELEVVSVQSDFEAHYEKSSLPQQRMLEKCLQLAQEKITSTTDYVVLPETSFSYVDLDHPMASETMTALGAFSRSNNLFLITGLSAHRYLEKEEEIELPTTRTIKGLNGSSAYVEAYNCAVQIDPQGNIQEYYKALYVPGAEFFPFKKILFFLKPLVDQLGGTISGYRIREKFNLFDDNAGTSIAPAICYESIFGEFITRFVQKGANMVFVMTNDGWWDNTAGYRQHADFARLRAIECRRDVVRSANMGISCLINQRGDISHKTTYGQASAINVKAHKNDQITFYSRWGDVIGRLSLFMLFLLVARSLVKMVRG